MGAVRTEHVSKRYTNGKGGYVYALRDISFVWREGESVALCGESGSGKSTFARLLLGLEQPSDGEIWLGGVPLSRLSLRQWRGQRRRLQGVFQDASGSLNPGWSVYRNMEEGLKNVTDLTAGERKREIGLLMERLGLGRELLSNSVRQLSGGEQRRVALLRALAVKPAFLVMDEVLSGLDLISADAVLSTLEDYRRGYGCAYLLITHDMYSAKRLGDKICVLEQGRLVRTGVREQANNEAGKP